jgi:hypothetical protein
VACTVQCQWSSFSRSTDNRSAQKKALVVASIKVLSVHVFKDVFAGIYQKRYLLQYLFIGKVGVRAFCEHLDVLIQCMTFFPTDNGVRFQALTERELMAVLHDAPPSLFIQNMKESNQQPLQVPCDTLRSFDLNIEEAARNSGVMSDNDDNEDQGTSKNSNKKAKGDRIPKKKNHGGGNHKSYAKKSILEGFPSHLCYFCGITSCHTEPKCKKKGRRVSQEATTLVKECKGNKWTPNRGSNGTPNQESSKLAQFQMFSQYEEYQKFQKT